MARRDASGWWDWKRCGHLMTPEPRRLGGGTRLDLTIRAGRPGPGLFAGGGASTNSLQAAMTAPNQALLGWWPLNATSGTAAANQITTRPAGTLVNGVTWVTDPERGAVAEFDGLDDRIDITATFIPRQTPSSEFTWSCWVKSTASATVDTPEDPHDGPTEQGASVILGNRSRFDGSGSFSPLEYIKMHPGGGSYFTAGNDESLASGYLLQPSAGWVHLAFVKRGAALMTYANGQLTGSRRLNAGLAVAMPFFIGGDPLSPAECFKGRISNVAVWTRALPERSIAGLFRGEYTPLTAPTLQSAAPPVTPRLPEPLAGTTVNAGPEPRRFRTSFTLDEAPTGMALELWAVADDGAVYFLNGTEVHRTNVPTTTTTANAAFPSSPVILPDPCCDAD